MHSYYAKGRNFYALTSNVIIVSAEGDYSWTIEVPNSVTEEETKEIGSDVELKPREYVMKDPQHEHLYQAAVKLADSKKRVYVIM